MQLQAVPELQREPGTEHAGEQPAEHCSKLARGSFNGVDTKYEHQVGQTNKAKAKIFWDADVSSFQLDTFGPFWFPGYIIESAMKLKIVM